MALFRRKKSKPEDKEIKDIINKNIASSLRTQPSFSEILKLNGCPSFKLGSIGSKISKQYGINKINEIHSEIYQK